MGVPVFGTIARKIFGTRNQRMVKRYLQRVDKVNALEEQMRSLTDAELRAKTDGFREAFASGASCCVDPGAVETPWTRDPPPRSLPVGPRHTSLVPFLPTA